MLMTVASHCVNPTLPNALIQEGSCVPCEYSPSEYLQEPPPEIIDATLRTYKSITKSLTDGRIPGFAFLPHRVIPASSASSPVVNQILVVRMDGIGDVVLSPAFLRDLRRNYPHAAITPVVSRIALNLVELCPYSTKCSCLIFRRIKTHFDDMLLFYILHELILTIVRLTWQFIPVLNTTPALSLFCFVAAGRQCALDLPRTSVRPGPNTTAHLIAIIPES